MALLASFYVRKSCEMLYFRTKTLAKTIEM